ncbi:hypothetical protein FS749_011423 [Ceratobasidium sp. UAMH 11750]|nr:hypothetical protein FS749_011423 [Ceratobasidium sp. UAMH 11750]
MRPKATRATVKLTTVALKDEETPDNSGNRNESSKRGEPPVRAAGRPRITHPEPRTRKKYVRGKQGGLQGIMKMPMEVFTEIMQHLGPGELVTLTRSNKFFRNMLLRQSAVHIWQRVQKNVPGLPPCPSGMCEPQYAALLFSKYCTLCGGHATAKPDPYLWARLCAPCRESKLTDRVDIPTYHKLGIDQSLVPYSSLIKPKNKANTKRGYSNQEYSLTQDVESVLHTQCDFLNAGDEQGLLRWVCNRRGEMKTRLEETERLKRYLQSAEELAGKQPRNAKQMQRREVYGRLRTIGWNDDDLDIDRPMIEAWYSIVDWPGLLTDKTWNRLLPQLTSILNSNRARHTQIAKLWQTWRRRQHIDDLVVHLRRTTHPFTQIINAVGIDFSRPLETFPEPFGESCALLQNPYPEFDVLILWGPFRDMSSKDLDDPEFDQLFAERQVQIEGAIKEWRDNLEQQLVDKFQTQPKEPGTEFPLTVKGRSDLTTHLSSNACFLLRADTVFRHWYREPTGGFDVYFYPGLNAPESARDSGLMHINLYGYLDQKYRFRNLGLDPHDYTRHTEAQAIAKSILNELEMPDATHFELIAMGKRFACGRCQESDHTWITIIHHYLHQLRNWNLQHNDPMVNAMRYPIIHHNTHNLESKLNCKRLIRILTEEGGKGVSEDTSADEEACLLCAFTECAWFQSCLDYMLVHMRDVHSVENPVKGLHYGRRGNPEAWLTRWEAFHDDQAATSTGSKAKTLPSV